MDASEFALELRRALAVDLSRAQLAKLDDLLQARAERRGRVAMPRSRPALLLVAGLLVAAPLVFVASAAIRSTESPRGMESAAGFQAEIDSAKAVVPLPAGATWPPYVNVPDPKADYSTGGGRSQVEGAAFCVWSESWLSAKSSGNAQQEEAARSVLLAVPGWELYRGEFATQSYRDVLDSVIAGARSGSAIPVERFVSVNCSTQ